MKSIRKPAASPAASSAATARERVDGRAARAAWWVFGIAFGIRVLAVVWLNFAPVALRPVMGIFVSDALLYDELGRSLAAGEGYVSVYGLRETAAVPPGFPLLLALLHFLRVFSVPLVGFLNAVWGGLTALMLWDLLRGSRFQNPATARSSERVAWLGALGFALYPLEIFNTPFVLKENWAICLTVGFVWAWNRALQVLEPRHKVWWAMLSGLFLGLSILSRFPHWGLLPLFVIANLLWRWQVRRESARTGDGESSLRPVLSFGAMAATVGVALLLLAPIFWRNYQLFGQPILSPHGPGRHLYFANSNLSAPESSGYYEARGQARAQDKVDAATDHDRVLQERTYARNALRDVLRAPGHTLMLVSAKLQSMWRPVWAGSSLRSWILLGLPYLAMMPLALLGFLWSRRDSRSKEQSEPPSVLVEPRTLQLLMWMIGFYAIGHAVFYGMIRERQYVEPYLIAFAAYALARLLLRREVRRAQNPAGAAA